MVELAIIGGIKRTALYRGLIKSVFLIYFYLYIFLNITGPADGDGIYANIRGSPLRDVLHTLSDPRLAL